MKVYSRVPWKLRRLARFPAQVLSIARTVAGMARSDFVRSANLPEVIQRVSMVRRASDGQLARVFLELAAVDLCLVRVAGILRMVAELLRMVAELSRKVAGLLRKAAELPRKVAELFRNVAALLRKVAGLP